MKKIIALLAPVLLVAMFATCPDKQAHQKAIAEVVNESVKETIGEQAGKSLASIGSALTSGLVDKGIEHMLELDNYYLFSLGKVEWKGERKTVSVGLLNQVFTVQKDQVKEQIGEKLHLGKKK